MTIVCIFMAALMILPLASTAQAQTSGQTPQQVHSAPAQSEIRVFLDGHPLSFDAPPIIMNGRTLVPLRAIFEAMNATVNWDASTQTVTAQSGMS